MSLDCLGLFFDLPERVPVRIISKVVVKQTNFIIQEATAKEKHTPQQ